MARRTPSRERGRPRPAWDCSRSLNSGRRRAAPSRGARGRERLTVFKAFFGRALPRKRAAIVSAGTAAPIGLVRQAPGCRSKRSSAAHSGDRNEPSPIRLLARARDASTRRLDDQQEARLSALPSRRAAAAHEDQTAQADQPTARSRDARHRPEPALEHGLRPRSDARRKEIPHPHRHRSVESRVSL